MKISERGRNAVMAMVDLAHVSGSGSLSPVRLRDIALRQDISQAFLEQIFVLLRRGGLVVSTRGAAGGYRLSRPSGDIRVSEIIAAVNESIDVTRCQAGAGCLSQNSQCLTHDLWAHLGDHIGSFFDQVSLADVVARRLPSIDIVAFKRDVSGGSDVQNLS